MVLTHLLDPMGPHWSQDGPYGVPTMIWRHNRNFHFLQKIDDRGGSWKCEFWGMVIFYGSDPFFGANGVRLGKKNGSEP